MGHRRNELGCSIITILGDPGAVSGGGKKAKRARKKIGRRKIKNESGSPWDSSLNRLVPKPNKTDPCPKIFFMPNQSPALSVLLS